jgi:hypothetical protein
MTSVYVVTGAAESATNTGSGGSLQTGLAVPNRRGSVLEVVVGAVVGGAFLI